MSTLDTLLGDVMDADGSMEEAVYGDGALDPVEKRLCGVVASCLTRDEPGLQRNIEAAKELGADEGQVSGAISAAWMTSGSTQLYWAEDTYEEHIEHAWFKRRLPEAAKAYGKFHDAIMEEGPLPETMMEVLCVVVGVMERCEHCTEAHITQALDKGATKDQVAEAIGVAWYEAGHSQVSWIEDTLDELLSGEAGAEEDDTGGGEGDASDEGDEAADGDGGRDGQ